MKALIVMKDAQVLYVWSDQQFQALNNIRKTDKHNEYVMVENHMVPLLAAFLTLEDNLNEGCSSINCTDGLTTVFQRHYPYIYIGIGRGENLSLEEELNRELTFLYRTVGLLYGRFGHLRLLSSTTSKKIKARKEISMILESYLLLCQTDNTFLMEAIESIAKLNDNSLNIHSLLKKYIRAFRKQSRLNVQYWMVFIDSKLLAMDRCVNGYYGLSMSSMLQIICLISAIEPQKHPKNPSETKKSGTFSEEKEIVGRNVEVELEIIEENEVEGQIENAKIIENCDKENSKIVTDLEYLENYEENVGFVEPSEESRIKMAEQADENVEENEGSCGESLGLISDVSGEIEMGSFLSSFNEDEEEMSKAYQHVSQYSENQCSSQENDHAAIDEASMMDFISVKEDHFTAYEEMSNRNKKLIDGIPIFLSTSKSPFIPFILHSIAMSDHIKIVFLSKVQHSQISDCVCGMYDVLQNIKFNESGKLDVVNGQNTVKNLEKCNKVLYSYTRKLSKNLAVHGKKIYETWIKDGQRNLQTYFKSGEGQYLHILKKCIPITKKYLRSLFENLFPSFDVQLTSTSNSLVLKQILSNCKNNLQDYQEYLELKSQQNYPLLHYLPNYPGLVHFSAVKRNRNIVLNEPLSASISLIRDELMTSAASFNEPFTQYRFKNYVNVAFANITKGIMETIINDKDFRFSSFIWLKEPDKSLRSLKTCDASDPYNLPNSSTVFSGDIFTNFSFDDDSEEGNICRTIYHVVCVHFSMVPHDVIKSQAYNLLLQNFPWDANTSN